mmetsp:Transcript_11267/g.16561  ORF Transcript_11267/g.16561 Transcript_11267/m.16561 type:complete len:106 (+) Transcript_11267:78-395(+)
MFSISRFTAFILCLVVASSTAFVSGPERRAVSAPRTFVTAASIFKKKQDEDLSAIESRDMTREEMVELNKKNEDIMNAELGAMTGFSLVLSLPILYLCWVAFFSD